MDADPKARRVFRFGLFEAHLSAGELRHEGRKINLQEQPFQILALLLERPGEVVTREELQRELWPKDTFVDFEAGLNTAIRKLREALGDSASNPRFVETLPRRGYRFIAAVGGPAAPPQTEGAVERQATGVSRRWIWGGTVAAAVLAAGLLGLNVGGLRERVSRSFGRGAQVKSLAVLPLENLTGDPSQDYFVDGMTDALTTELAQIGGLRVISRTSVMQYKGTKKPLPAIARELNVEGVVEGAVMRSGQRVRITAQLIHAPTDRHLWAQSFERDLGDVVAFQGQVARAITEEIEVKLTPQERARLTTPRLVSPEAYDAYLKGRYYLHQQTSEGYLKAIKHFEEAIAREPDYALAYVELSHCYRLLGFLGPLSPLESMPKAEAAARKALELNETLAEAHMAIATIAYRFHWDWFASEREFRRALQLNPNYAEGHRMYSIFLSWRGRFEESLAEVRRALDLDPLPQPAAIDNLGYAFFWAGQYDRALEEFRVVRDMNPESAQAHRALGTTYTLKGQFREAIAEQETAVELSRRNPHYLTRLGYAYAAAGKQLAARKVLEELQARSRQQYVSPLGIALIYVGLGQKEAALAWLEKAYQARDFDLALLAIDRRLEPLRSDPRFQDLLRRLGLPP